jgi:hypothetical protein
MKKSNEELHRELWNWCAETGKGKYAWPGWNYYKDLITNCYCFACEEAEIRSNHGDDSCNSCPILWSDDPDWGNWCAVPNTFYSLWASALKNKDIETAKKYAKLIAEMPWRER